MRSAGALALVELLPEAIVPALVSPADERAPAEPLAAVFEPEVRPAVVPGVGPVAFLPAAVPPLVLDDVCVDCVADVLWLVVALGEIVTVLCGIALNCASELTVVFALGLTAWLLLLLDCANGADAKAASAAPRTMASGFLFNIWYLHCID